MKLPRTPHSWTVSPREAVAIQEQLADRVIRIGGPRRLRLIAGADLAFSQDGNECIAGCVLWDVQRDGVVEQYVVRKPVAFPYVPGLLTFREAPALLAALRLLKREPDAFLFDGQGYAHPRRMGLASHMGVLIDRPSIGCAKSVLIGTFSAPRAPKGSASPMEHNGECVGMAVRTRDGVQPMYISVGHRTSLSSAVRIALACCTRFRVPQPTRLADQLVARARNATRE